MSSRIIDNLLQVPSQKMNLIFAILILGGSATILVAFYLINTNSLVNDEFLPAKLKIMGIGALIAIVHISLTCIARTVLTQLQKAKSIINQQNYELQKIDKAKSEFVAMVTHDLKTPIVPIASYSAMLAQGAFGELSEVQKEKLGIIITSAECLQNLILDMHDIYKADLDKLTLNPEPIDICEIIQQSIDITQPLANKHGVIFESLAASLEITVDKQRMIQVLTNLFKNAIDFVPYEYGIIRIETQLRNDCVIISVIDNGMGIPKEKIGNLFSRFCRLDSSNSGGRSSSGLGLSICKAIVEQHGGKIWAESSTGKGTTIKISLPAAPRCINLTFRPETEKQWHEN